MQKNRELPGGAALLIIASTSGTGPLYEELRTLFNRDCPATGVHRLFAELPSVLQAKGRTPQPLRSLKR